MWTTTLLELITGMNRWRRRRDAIAALSALDDRLLADIGLHRSEIYRVVDAKLAAETAPAARPDSGAAVSACKPPRSTGWVGSCNA